MKKNSLLKAMLYVFIAYVILSWIIPAGYIQNGTLVASETKPVGLLDLVRYPIIAFSSSVFVLQALVILAIGGFYSVLNKTGVYGNIIESIKKKFKGKEFRFVIISTVLFTVLSSLTALSLPLLVLVPFFVAGILSLGYKKGTAFLATFGSILVGNIASTYGFNTNGYMYYFLNVDMNAAILYRAGLLILLLVILLVVVNKVSKKEINGSEKPKKSTKKSTKKTTSSEEKTKDELCIPFYDGSSSKKRKATSLSIVGILLVIISLISMYNWAIGLNIKIFTDIYESITNYKINGYPIFANIIGSVDPFGYWSNYELILLLVVASLLIGWIYNLKLKDVVSSFGEGARKISKVAFYVILANIVFLMLNSSNTGANIYATIAGRVLDLTKGFNIFTTGLSSLIGGLFYNDYPYMLNSLYATFTSYNGNVLPLVGIVTISLHGFMMLIVPTSIVLVCGLTYLDIPYTTYLKKALKYLLIALVAIVVVLAIAALIIK